MENVVLRVLLVVVPACRRSSKGGIFVFSRRYPRTTQRYVGYGGSPDCGNICSRLLAVSQRAFLKRDLVLLSTTKHTKPYESTKPVEQQGFSCPQTHRQTETPGIVSVCSWRGSLTGRGQWERTLRSCQNALVNAFWLIANG